MAIYSGPVSQTGGVFQRKTVQDVGLLDGLIVVRYTDGTFHLLVQSPPAPDRVVYLSGGEDPPVGP